MAHDADLRCPACGGFLARRSSAYDCIDCGCSYPILHGIPDFRLSSDRYLTLEEERAKAAQLAAFAETHGFSEVLAEYYRITDDVPLEMAQRYAAYVVAGEARGRAQLQKLAPHGRSVLDVGCGAGGFVLAAVRQGRDVTGMDVALRWLVISRTRLREAGVEANLICADIAAPPIAPGRFDALLASDVMEHLTAPDAALIQFGRMLQPGGKLLVTAANRFTLARYPPAGLLGVGWMPAPLRRRYVVRRRGFDTLRYLAPQSPIGLARGLVRAGFVAIEARPMEISEPERFGPVAQKVLALYGFCRRIPLVRRALTLIGPVFEVTARRRMAGEGET